MRAADTRPQVALYWDFENIHAGLCDEQDPGAYARNDVRFKPQEPLVDVQAVADLAASYGAIAIHRAYGNWQFFGRYRDVLLQHAIDLVQLFPPGGLPKNGADIRLCLDATEDMARHPHIDTVVVVGGDSDFMPLAQKLKTAGRTLVGIGTRKATNRHWARSCHAFHYYDAIVPPARDIAPEAAALRRALWVLGCRHGARWVDQDEVLALMQRLDPMFDPSAHGHADIDALLHALDASIERRDGESGPQMRWRAD